jgi:hypothetical protein
MGLASPSGSRRQGIYVGSSFRCHRSLTCRQQVDRPDTTTAGRDGRAAPAKARHRHRWLWPRPLHTSAADRPLASQLEWSSIDAAPSASAASSALGVRDAAKDSVPRSRPVSESERHNRSSHFFTCSTLHDGHAASHDRRVYGIGATLCDRYARRLSQGRVAQRNHVSSGTHCGRCAALSFLPSLPQSRRNLSRDRPPWRYVMFRPAGWRCRAPVRREPAPDQSGSG